MSKRKPRIDLKAAEELLEREGLTVTGRRKKPLPPGYPESVPPLQALPQAPVYAPPPPFYPYSPNTYRTSLASVLGNADATVAKVTYELFDPRAGHPITFTGSGASKREREDQHDAVTGEVLAAARAYQELSARLFREARKRVRIQDAERQARARRARKRAAAQDTTQVGDLKPSYIGPPPPSIDYPPCHPSI